MSEELVLLSPGCEPDTQQINSQNTCSDDDLYENESDLTWGWLHPTGNFKFEPLSLQKNEYSFGRAPRCDVRITEENIGNTLTLSVVSKVHFRILRETLSSNIEVAHLEDMSMNGTYVNKSKVGKGKKHLLNNNDEIALANPHGKIYIFVDTSLTKDWIPREMKRIYCIKTTLGSGAYGEVKLAQDKRSGRLVAIKKVKKQEGKENKIMNEVKILQEIKHPCIVKLEDVFETCDSLFIILEYVRGGELATRMREVRKMSDSEAKAIFFQLVLALQYLHNKGVAHRDLKPENVLLSQSDNSELNLVKVSDFGLSKLTDSKTDLNTFCGTPLYTAPEILVAHGTSTYTHQVDIWSLGVIMFYCVSGKFPFSKARPLPVMEQIVRASYSMSGPEWRGVSNNAASLIRKMLKADPNQRITVDDILSHPWLQDNEMKVKVLKLMETSSLYGDENLSPTILMPPTKRQKMEDNDTVRKS